MITLPGSLLRALERKGQDLTLLVVRLGAFGDILRTLPPVRLVRRALPAATIYWVLEDKWRSVLDGHPDLNGSIVIPRKTWSHLARAPWRWPALLSGVLGFRRELRAPRATLLLDFHGNLRSGVAGALSGAPVRVGYTGHQQKEGNRWLTTHQVASGDRRTPRMERNLDLVRALGLPVAPLPGGALPLVDRGAAAAGSILEDERIAGRPVAVISPGASVQQAAKKPPGDSLAAACRALAGRGVVPLVVWGPGEEPDARRVVARVGAAAVLAPPTDLATLAALLARARQYVGGDSGPMHLACAVGCPAVAIYGPTDPRVNRPWLVPFRTVCPPGRRYTGIKKIDRRAGFEGLEPAAVESAVLELLDETQAAAGSAPGSTGS